MERTQDKDVLQQNVHALDAHTLSERLECERKGCYWMHLEAASPLDKYPAKQHARRVQEKLGAEAGLIYLPGASNRNIEDSDMPVKFRQKRYFYYLSGCNEPDCLLVYNIRKDALTLFLPKIDPRRVLFYGRGSTKAEAMNRYDIDEVRYVDELEAFIAEWAEDRQGSVYILHPTQRPRLSEFHVPINSKALQPAMNLARVVKDQHEINLIKKANDISSLAHREVLAHIQEFKNEAQVEGLFLNMCVSKHAKEQAYDPIAASGPNAGTLHYAANNEDFGDRQLMCLDAGCEYELYASDITRTFPLSGSWPSSEAEEIYRLVQRMQETCIERLAPGVRYLDLHILAHQIAIDGLLKLGILHNGTREEIFKAGTSRAFFPHGLGHHVGLEVHDVGQADLMSMMKGNPMYEKAPSLYPESFHLPVYDATSCMAPTDPQSGHLEEGMVVTVEPGIYFSTFLLNNFYLPSPIHSQYINKAVVQKYLAVGGVRIEDDILITSRGYENLTTAPKGEAMLEIIRSQNAQWPFVSSSADLGPVDRNSRLSCKPIEGDKLVKAPGIARDSPDPIHVSLARVQTLPAEKKDRKTFDFEPFNGPSLYTNFKRASTIDNPVAQKTANPNSDSKPHARRPRIPVCGGDSPEVEHAYMNIPGERGNSSRRSMNEKKPVCKNCSVLVQTLGRLRQNLSISEQGLPKSTFDGFGTQRMGIEPLRSASKSGLIDASIRSHPHKSDLIHESNLRNLTASPVPMEPQEMQFKKEAGPVIPDSSLSLLRSNLENLNISEGISRRSSQAIPRVHLMPHQQRAGIGSTRQRDNVTNWLESTATPQVQPPPTPNYHLRCHELDNISFGHYPPQSQAVASSSPPMIPNRINNPNHSSPPLMSAVVPNKLVLPPSGDCSPSGLATGSEVPRNQSNPIRTESTQSNFTPDTYKIPPMRQVRQTYRENSLVQLPVAASKPSIESALPVYLPSNCQPGPVSIPFWPSPSNATNPFRVNDARNDYGERDLMSFGSKDDQINRTESPAMILKRLNERKPPLQSEFPIEIPNKDSKPQAFGYGQPNKYCMTFCGSGAPPPVWVDANSEPYSRPPPIMSQGQDSINKSEERIPSHALPRQETSAQRHEPIGYGHALVDYQQQLMLLEESNKIRLALARQEQEEEKLSLRCSNPSDKDQPRY
ncbi:hypothetical protein B0J11DRAFT_234425 [Dendryphion nanum]|uniref:Xaa-Pro aminopeptidase n=1 Tax=Dendryphion nanum TaxID=256645 RepID=A0A9P9CZV2_9PLEO|nr:hypothetical protein B0J11DRAFT_234425 [Dendryphion nanum]